MVPWVEINYITASCRILRALFTPQTRKIGQNSAGNQELVNARGLLSGPKLPQALDGKDRDGKPFPQYTVRMTTMPRSGVPSRIRRPAPETSRAYRYFPLI